MTDVFPRRNLSPDAEPWGREIEKRVVTLEGVASATKSGVSGQNRTTASTLGDLARQLDRIDALYRSIPKPKQATSESNGFGLSSGWNTIASVSIPVPDGTDRAEIFAVGSAFLNNTVASPAEGDMRLVADGSASPTQAWAYYSDSGGYHASITPGFAWTREVTPGSSLVVSIQVNPSVASTWGYNASNYAVIAVMVTFTG